MNESKKWPLQTEMLNTSKWRMVNKKRLLNAGRVVQENFDSITLGSY